MFIRFGRRRPPFFRPARRAFVALLLMFVLLIGYALFLKYSPFIKALTSDDPSVPVDAPHFGYSK